MTITWNIESFDTLPSTQSHLKEQITSNKNLPEGTVISAVKQFSGVGRHGRIWESPEGNLATSFLIRPDCPISQTGQLSLLTGLSVLQTIYTVINVQTFLKWPNDILIDEKKCCGILIDAVEIEDDIVKSLVIGIGLNIQNAPTDNTVDLSRFSARSIPPPFVLENILERFDHNYQQWKAVGFNSLRIEWIENSYPKGTKVSVKINDDYVSGAFEDIDTLGNLIILCDKTGKQRKITSGDVFLL